MRDYAELVRAMRYCLSDAGDCSGCPMKNAPHCTDEVFQKAADAIEALLAAVPKWNPASKPPKEKGDYWCNVRSYNFDDTYYQHEVWFDGECFVIDGVCTERVTHWMPLPESPKEVSDDA